MSRQTQRQIKRLLRGGLAAAILYAPAAAGAQAAGRTQPVRMIRTLPAAPITAPAGPASRAYVRTIAQLGFPNGLSLAGLSAERVISFRLPAGAPLDSANLELRLRFPRAALPESNLQIFVNGERLGVAMRSAADSGGATTFRATVPRSMLGGDYATVTLRSASSTLRDRCLDQRLALGYVDVAPSSSFTYYAADGAVRTIRQVWASLPDTVTLSLPNRQLTAREFRAAYTVGIAASNEGRSVRYARLPTLGDVVVGAATDLPTSDSGFVAPAASANIGVFHFAQNGVQRNALLFDARSGSGTALAEAPWSPLATEPGLVVRQAGATLEADSDDPTFAEMGLVDLRRDLRDEAEWKLPIDLRDLPSGRAPSRADIRLVTAPNTNDRQLVFYAFLNGVLVRSADITEGGGQQLIGVRLPASLLTTHNELRVLIQRHLPSSDLCNQGDRPMPAQIMPSSQIITTKADRGARAFAGVTAQLAPNDPVYVPDRALTEPAEFLPMLVSLGRALWSAKRAPVPTFYGATPPASPTGAFVVIGRPLGVTFDGPSFADSGHFVIHRKNVDAPLVDIAELRDWSMAQVVGWNGHLGVQLLPAVGRRRIPDSPAAYGGSSLVLANADSTVLQVNTAGRNEGLLFNEGPTLLERIRADWQWWALFALLVVVPPIVLAVRAIVRRTPRRELRRPVTRPATDSAS